MVTSILAILAALAVPLGALLVFLIKRKTSVGAQLTKQKEENAQAIANGDVNALLNERINGVRPVQTKTTDSSRP